MISLVWAVHLVCFVWSELGNTNINCSSSRIVEILGSAFRSKASLKGTGQGSDLQGQLLKAWEDHWVVQETASVAGSQLGWTGNSWLSSSTKRKYIESGSRNGIRNMERTAWAWRVEMRKPKAWLEFKLMRDRKGNKRNIVSALEVKGRATQMQIHCWMWWVTWWWRI